MTNAKSEPDAADRDFFHRLRDEVEREIEGYVYDHPADAIGSPLPDYVIREDLNICNSLGNMDAKVVRRMCVTMAEDEGYVLVFDPVDEEYHLAWRGKQGLGTWGIRGDAVGCFIAR
jgi:hypothetical protein